MRYAKRRWTKVAAALAAASLGLAACGSGDTNDDPDSGGGDGAQVESLRITWWGGDSENTAINAVLDKYQDSTGITVNREALAWDGYWDKLATTTANRGAPDIVMQAGSQIPTYAGNGALVDLTSVAELDLSAIDEGLQPFGMVDDANYGIVAAANAMGIVVNDDLMSAANVTIPEGPYSWKDLAQIATDIHAADPEVWGMQDSGGDLISLILWVRAEGREFYNDDGTLQATREDIVDWLQYWEDLRQAGAVPPADVTAEGAGQGVAGAPLAKGTTAMGTAWTQDFVGFQHTADLPFSMHLPPYSEEHPSLWMNAASLWSISTSSEKPEAAAELINYMISDEEAVDAMGLSLGIPPSQSAREQLSSDMSDAEKAASDYMDKVAENQRPLNRLWPKSFAPMRTKLGEINEAVAFGSITVEQGADELLQEYEANQE